MQAYGCQGGRACLRLREARAAAAAPPELQARLRAFGALAQADFVGPAPAWVLLGQPAPAARERPQAERFEAQRLGKDARYL